MWGPRALMQPREHRCCRMFSKRRRRNAKGSYLERNPQWFCSLARTAKTPARSGAECGVKAISAIGCAAQLAEQHKPRARARTHRGRTRAQWPQHPGPSSPSKSRVCDCSHTQCSNTRPRAGRTLAERCALPRFRPRRFRPRQQGSPAQSSPAQGSPVIAQVCSSTPHVTLLSAAPFCWASALLAHTRTHARSTRTHACPRRPTRTHACPRRGRRGKDAEVGAHRP